MTTLPGGWKQLRLDEVADLTMGQSPPGETYNETGEGLPFFQGKAEFGEVSPTPKKWCTAGTRFAIAGDILLSVRAPVGPTNTASEECVIGRGLAGIRATDIASQRYLLHYLAYSDNHLKAKATGTTFSAITGKVLHAHEVLVPPIDEQDEVVRILDTQLARLDSVLGAVRTVREKAAQFRRSLLRDAFNGQLTQPDPSRGTDSPAGWRTLPLGECVSLLNGYAFKSSWFTEVGVNLARGMNIGHGQLDWTDRRTLSPERAVEFERFQLSEGDLLLALDRPIISTGLKWATVRPSDIPCLLLQRVARMRADHAVLSQQFLRNWNQSPYLTDVIDPGRSMGVPHISTKEVAGLRICLPPRPEQDEIVRILDTQLSRLDDALRVADRVEAQCNRLRRSLLQAAFTGQLTKKWRESRG